MSRLNRLALPAVTLAALVLGAGCSSSTPGTAAPAPAPPGAPAATEGDPVAWVDSVCGAVLPLSDLSTPPDIDTSDPAAALQGLADYLGEAADVTGESITSLEQVGPSPEEGGDEAVDSIVEALTSVRTAFEDAQTQVEAADPNDPASLQEALAPLAELQNLPDPTEGLQESPELDAAAEEAPNCQQLDTAGN